MRLVILILLAASCSWPVSREAFYPKNPYDNLKKIAVLPVKNLTRTQIDNDLFSNVMSSELSRFDVGVIRPSIIKALNPAGTIETAEDIGKSSVSVNADAVLECIITDYDAFNPPRISIQIGLYRAKARELSRIEIDELTKSATWKKKDFKPEMAGHVVALFELTVDASSLQTKAEIETYSKLFRETDSPWASGQDFMAIQEKFWQFASNRAFNKIFTVKPN